MVIKIQIEREKMEIRKELIKINKRNKFENKNLVFIILSLYIQLYILQVFSGTFKLYKFEYLFANIILLYSITIILFSVIKKIIITLLVTNVLTYGIFGFLNYFLIQVTDSPFSFFDIFIIKSGLNSIESFSIDYTKYFYIATFLFILNMLFIIFFISEDEWLNKLKKIPMLILGLLAIFIIWFLASPKLHYITYKSDALYGTLYRFLKTTKNVSLVKPEGYSEEKVREILSKYSKEKSVTSDEEKPNVIVIMNESLSDINSVYKMGLKDNLKFIKSNSNGTTLYSSVFGNRTANSEYEFLTGFSTVFYNEDIIPYQKYIKSKKYSLVEIMKNNGYKTYVNHPYLSSSYNRNEVYKMFEFDRVYFDNSINNINLAKICNSDLNIYKNVINYFENKNKDEKVFDFIITLQNHSPYINKFEKYKTKYPEYEDKIIEFENSYENKYNIDGNKKLTSFMNFSNLSDKAFEYLINYFENYDEKVIIMMFGDHQPKLLNEIYKNEKKNYIVSYALWANYDIEKKKISKISINYLSTVLLKIIGIEDKEYFNYISHLREKIPVITRAGYLGDDGKWYKLTNTESSYYELIKEYQYVQYYYMTKN